MIKRRNVQDATLKNIRLLKKRVTILEIRVDQLKNMFKRIKK